MEMKLLQMLYENSKYEPPEMTKLNMQNQNRF